VGFPFLAWALGLKFECLDEPNVLRVCSWSESSGLVFNALSEDFMKDTIKEVMPRICTQIPSSLVY